MTGLETAAIKEIGTVAIKEGINLSKELIEKIASGGTKQITKWNRYYLIYAPLRMLMFDLHICIFKSNVNITFPEKWRKAKPELVKLRFRKFFKKLFDYEILNEIEVTGRREFPIKEIRAVLEKNAELADAKLINLFHWVVKDDAEDSMLSNYGRDFLTESESKLRYHIFEVYESLNKEFIG